MTSQIPGQMPQPGPLEQAAPPAADGARRCKQPGCGTELPAATGRGAPRLFCSPACSRKWHNDSRLAPGAAGSSRPPCCGRPAGLREQLLAQAAELADAAAAQLAAADPGRVTATLAAADAARRQAQAETAVALAQAAGAVQAGQAATAAMHAARHDTQAALEAADAARADACWPTPAPRPSATSRRPDHRDRRQADTALAAACDDTRAAHADRDAALASADQARHHAGNTEIRPGPPSRSRRPRRTTTMFALMPAANATPRPPPAPPAPAARPPGPSRHLARPRRARRTATRPRTRPPAPPRGPAPHRHQRRREA